MGLTQGLLAALVARHAPEDLRGSAFGVFNLASGVALLVASVLAGLLWDACGPRSTFLAGAAFTPSRGRARAAAAALSGAGHSGAAALQTASGGSSISATCSRSSRMRSCQ